MSLKLKKIKKHRGYLCAHKHQKHPQHIPTIQQICKYSRYSMIQQSHHCSVITTEMQKTHVLELSHTTFALSMSSGDWPVAIPLRRAVMARVTWCHGFLPPTKISDTCAIKIKRLKNRKHVELENKLDCLLSCCQIFSALCTFDARFTGQGAEPFDATGPVGKSTPQKSPKWPHMEIMEIMCATSENIHLLILVHFNT